MNKNLRENNGLLLGMTSVFVKNFCHFSAFIIPFAIMTASDFLMRIKQTPKRLSLAIIVSQAVLISGFFCYNYLCAVDGGGFMGLTQVSHIVIAVITAHLIYLSVLLLLQIVVISRFIQKIK